MTNNLTSIIIPLFNSEKYILDTISSVRNQTIQEWECIIVDDGSTDTGFHIATEQALKDSRIKVFKRPDYLPKGGNSCRNFGFEQASGEFIQWFDSDDLMEPFMIERKTRVLIEDRSLDFVVSKMSILRNGIVEQDNYNIDSSNRIVDFLAYKFYFLTPGPLFRKDFLVEKELFSTELKRHQEWEFFSRLLIGGSNYFAIDEYHCIRRIHDKSIKHVFDSMNPLERAYFKIFAIDVLNRKTENKVFGLLSKLFYKRMAWAVFMCIKTLDFQHFRFFLSVFLSFSWKNLLQVFKKQNS